MNHNPYSSAPISHANRVKMAKEHLSNKQVQKELDRSATGLKKPCVFGKHNSNFNKNCLK